MSSKERSQAPTRLRESSAAADSGFFAINHEKKISNDTDANLRIRNSRLHMFQLVSRLLQTRKNKRETEKHESATLDSESGRVLMRLFFAQHSVYGHITEVKPS